MNTTVRKRIEQINRGEVPQGYKRTKIGIIPEDWEVVEFNKMFQRITRKNTEKNDNVLTISARYGLISQKDFFLKSVASEDTSNYFLLEQGDFAYNKSYSNGYPYGAIKRLLFYNKGIVSPLYICFHATRENKCADYYSQYFEDGKFNREIKSISQEGARNHGLLNMSIDDFFKISIIKFDFNEMKKVTAILQTQDRAIELQEQLLEQKQLQKKYLVQQLLTGKIRLKGFTSEWEKTKLDDILKERNEYCIKNGKYKHVTLSTDGIYAKTDRYDRDFLVASDEKKYKVTHYGDICYNPANLKFGVICLNKFGDAIFSPIYVTFEINKNVNFDFLDLYLKQKNFINSVRKYEEGSIYERMAVKPRDMLLFEIKLPSKEEQDAIAKILITADREIELIQEKLREERLKKKALMQLLLTGIVRV